MIIMRRRDEGTLQGTPRGSVAVRWQEIKVKGKHPHKIRIYPAGSYGDVFFIEKGKLCSRLFFWELDVGVSVVGEEVV